MQPYSPPPGGFGYANQQQQNPYAAPNPYNQQVEYRANANFFVPPGAMAGSLPTPWLKTGKLVCGITSLVFILIGFVMFIGAAATADPHGNDPGVLPILGMLVIMLGYFLFFGYAVLNWIWTYQIWSWIPPEERWGGMWKKYISPGTALGFMFIPYFNIYWQFVIYLGIGDIMDRMAVRYPSQEPSVKGFAMVPPILRLVFFPALPIVDYMFAKKVERKATEMMAAMGRPLA